jgi:hypothetical protein
MHRALFLLACLFIHGISSAQNTDTAMISRLQTINQNLHKMYALHPFNDEAPNAIDSINQWIDSALNHALNLPDFSIKKYRYLLSEFTLTCSPDSAVWFIGWYLNNGGSWMMEYGGFYFENEKVHRFLQDNSNVTGAIKNSPIKPSPFAGVVADNIYSIKSKKTIYLANCHIRTCGTCGTLIFYAFTIDENGLPQDYNAFDTSCSFGTECRLNDVNELSYSPGKKMLQLKLVYDDLNRYYSWFKTKPGQESPDLNYLKIEYRWEKTKFVLRKIRRKKMKQIGVD